MNPSSHSLTWTSQSKNSSENMPCGGCDTGLCVWMEDGILRFYMDRSGSFDENNQMLKLGRVSLECSPNPFAQPDCQFSQTLDLETGQIQISGQSSVPGLPKIRLTVWCETDSPAVHLEAEADSPFSVKVQYESWRFADRPVPPERRMPCFSLRGYPKEVLTFADSLSFEGDGFLFYHQNKNDQLCLQKVAELELLGDQLPQMYNPQKNFLFGGYLCGENLQRGDITEGTYACIPFRGYSLESRRPALRHAIAVGLFSDYSTDINDYRKNAVLAGKNALEEQESRRKIALSFWKTYWEKSWIDILPDSPDPENTAWQVGRNYQLFRYMLGCNAKGAYPTKFNGGLFTSDACWSVSEEYFGETPDFRAWGGGSFTAQNQRLVYWPMLKSGDADSMPSQFSLYNRALPNAKLRVKTYWGHEGCTFGEHLETFGLPTGYEWGWPDGGSAFPQIYFRRMAHDSPETANPCTRYHYSTQLEFCYMILQYASYFDRDITEYRDLIYNCVAFYDQHYRMRHLRNCTRELDRRGKLVIFPSTALETYKDATNPTDAVAALDGVLRSVLEVHRKFFTEEQLAYFQSVRDILPPLCFREVEGKRVISPAQSWSDITNIELPQLYPVFPYEQYGLLKPDLETAVNTYLAPTDLPSQRDYISWHQDNIFAARLGLTEEAQKFTFQKLQNGPRRFPAYWGPGHDWVPDHNWGGSGMIGLQDMLLQCVLQNGEETILLFPAWPRDLDVHFQLHAFHNTVIQAEMKDGVPKVIAVSGSASILLADGKGGFSPFTPEKEGK